MKCKRITLVGFGLLAGSIAAAVKQAKLPLRIRAVSSAATLARAREMDLADETFGYDEIERWLPGSDLILLCSPILHILQTLDVLAKNAALCDGPVLVSDIGSTKKAICEAGARLPAPFCFVGGHPMAGSEKRSAEFNDPALFENAYWLLCPPAGSSPDVFAPLSELLEFLGAHPVVLDPADHDRIMAWVSHMPQMVSSALASSLSPWVREHGYQHLAGRGFRDMTRIAASAWSVWRDILLTNSEEISTALEGFASSALSARDAVAALPRNEEAAKNIFSEGNQVRASLSDPGKNYASAFHEVVVQIPDEPGTIVKVVQPVSDAGLNIRDIELMKVREGIAGTLLLAFKTDAEAQESVRILTSAGFAARQRS